jgi:hypothetical protein
MPDTYPTVSAERVAAYTRKDQRFVAMSVRERKADTAQFLDAGLRAIRAGIDARADRVRLQDMAGFLHDAVANLVGGMRRDLDDAYLPPEDADIDMGELDQLITTLERRT